MKWNQLFSEKSWNVDAVLLTSRENKYYAGGPYSDSGYVLLLKEFNETYVMVDGRYYTDMKAQNKEDQVVLLDAVLPFTDFMHKLGKEKKLSVIGVEDTMTAALYLKMQKSLPFSIEVLNLQNMRKIKNAREVEEIKAACAIAADAYAHILSIIQVGMKERDVANELVYYMKKQGAEKESFDTIVLSGVRGALPHGKPSDKLIEDGDFVTIDFGAVYHHYCSDITRTFQVGKKENTKVRALFDTVLTAQKAAIAAIKPGLACSEIDHTARAMIAEAGYGSYFVHNLGHSMGILCHEDPRFSPSETELLRPGMVLTVEPGIYIEGLGGVRIEDDILVTETGCEVLTKQANKEYIRIEG